MTTIRVVAIVLISIMVGPFLNEENDLYISTSTLADHTIFVIATQLESKADYFGLNKPCKERESFKEKFDALPQIQTIVKKVNEYQDRYPSSFVDILYKNCTLNKFEIVHAFQDVN